MSIRPKNFFFTKFEYGYQINAGFYTDLETPEQNAKNLLTKSYRQKKCAKKVLTNNFFWDHFFPIISTDLKSAENSAFFGYSYVKKEIQKFGGIEYKYEYFWK